MVTSIVSGRLYYCRFINKRFLVKILGRHMLGGWVAVNLVNNRRLRLINSRRLESV